MSKDCEKSECCCPPGPRGPEGRRGPAGRSTQVALYMGFFPANTSTDIAVAPAYTTLASVTLPARPGILRRLLIEGDASLSSNTPNNQIELALFVNGVSQTPGTGGGGIAAINPVLVQSGVVRTLLDVAIAGTITVELKARAALVGGVINRIDRPDTDAARVSVIETF